MAQSSRKPVVFGQTPRVSLLPEKQRAEQVHEKTLPKLLLALVLSGVVAGAIWAAGSLPVILANQELLAVEAQSQALLTEISSYADAQQALSAVGDRSSDREQITQTEVLFMDLRDQIVAKVPAGSSLVFISTALPGTLESAGEAPAAEGSCAATGASVTLTLSTPGGSNGLVAAAALLDGVSELSGFACGFVVDSRVLGDADVTVAETQLRFSFTEEIRALRFAEGVDK